MEKGPRVQAVASARVRTRVRLGWLALLFAIVVMFLFGGWTQADSPGVHRVRVSAEVSGARMTPEEARREALQRAREQAIIEVAGINVAAQQLRLKSERQGEVLDAFSTIIRTSSQARIVDEEVVYEVEIKNEVPVYRAILLASVALETGERDPGFTLSLRTHPETHTFRNGENLTIEVEVSRPCYLLLLNVLSDGNVVQLVPSPALSERRLTPGESKRYPPPGESVRFKVGLLDGRRRDQEMILAIATRDDIPFNLQDDGEPEGRLHTASYASTLEQLNRWLVDIQLDRRVEASWIYEIVE